MVLLVWDGSLQEQSAAARASVARQGRTGLGLVSTWLPNIAADTLLQTSIVNLDFLASKPIRILPSNFYELCLHWDTQIIPNFSSVVCLWYLCVILVIVPDFVLDFTGFSPLFPSGKIRYLPEEIRWKIPIFFISTKWAQWLERGSMHAAQIECNCVNANIAIARRCLSKFCAISMACKCKNVLHNCRGSGLCLNIEALGTSVRKFMGPIHARKYPAWYIAM